MTQTMRKWPPKPDQSIRSKELLDNALKIRDQLREKLSKAEEEVRKCEERYYGIG